MYGREYNEQVYTLEASGGLINASLIMRDRETDSFWSLMTSEVIAGKLSGTQINELPIGTKTIWKKWLQKHPKTMVLSVNDKEDAPFGYARYFTSEGGFRGLEATDDRLSTKAQVYSFHYNGQPYAVSAKKIEGGAAFDVGGKQLFFYRPKDAAMYFSSIAVIGDKFEQKDGVWTETTLGVNFNVEEMRFRGDDSMKLKAVGGFDTFWYNWSLTNPDTELLGQ